MGDIREVIFKDPVFNGALLTERFVPSNSAVVCPHCAKKGSCYSRIEFETSTGFSENVCVRCGCVFWLKVQAPAEVGDYDRAATDALREQLGIKAPYKVPAPAELEEVS